MSSFIKFFARVSLGNIGSNQAACMTANLEKKANSNDPIISCAYGTLLKLQKYGFTEDNNSTCVVDRKKLRLQKKCQSKLLLSVAGSKKLDDHYEKKCHQKTLCSFPVDTLFTRDDFSTACQSEYDERVKLGSKKKLELILYTQCFSEKI